MGSNAIRWVVLSFVAAVLFAVGLVTLVGSQVDRAKAEAQAASNEMDERMERETHARTGRLEAAAAVAVPFIAHVGAGRFAEAHALLAAPYRNAISVEAFARTCRTSAILAGARRVTLRELRQQQAGAASSLEARGVLESAAGAVPIGFVFLQEEAGPGELVPRILVVSLGGVPVLQGVTGGR